MGAASPADVVMGGGPVLVRGGWALRCHAVPCGAVRCSTRSRGLQERTWEHVHVHIPSNNPDAGCWTSQPREAGRAKEGMELKAVWSWFWSEER